MLAILKAFPSISSLLAVVVSNTIQTKDQVLSHVDVTCVNVTHVTLVRDEVYRKYFTNCFV